MPRSRYRFLKRDKAQGEHNEPGSGAQDGDEFNFLHISKYDSVEVLCEREK